MAILPELQALLDLMDVQSLEDARAEAARLRQQKLQEENVRAQQEVAALLEQVKGYRWALKVPVRQWVVLVPVTVQDDPQYRPGEGVQVRGRFTFNIQDIDRMASHYTDRIQSVVRQDPARVQALAELSQALAAASPYARYQVCRQMGIDLDE